MYMYIYVYCHRNSKVTAVGPNWVKVVITWYFTATGELWRNMWSYFFLDFLSPQIWSMWSGCSSWWQHGTGMCGWSQSAGRSPTKHLKTSTCGCWLTTPVTLSTSQTFSSSSPDCNSSAEETSWSVRETGRRSVYVWINFNIFNL